MTPTLKLALALALVLVAAGCDRIDRFRKPAPREPEKHLDLDPKEIANLSENEYLMRRATLGSRPERFEALDVIERSNDAAFVEFLLDRLKKEDDRFLQIRIMHVLSKTGDVRAVAPLRYIARWDQSRVGIEATVALYELGDDSMVPRVIQKMRVDDESPELIGIAHRSLKRMTGADLPASPRAWTNYYRSHRLAPYQARTWYLPFRTPLPPTAPGTTKIALNKGKLPLPKENVRVRRTNMSFSEFWRPDEP